MPTNRTDAQKAASRANGRKSHGPGTPLSKSHSSRNSLKHGALAATLLLPGENADDFTALCLSVSAQLQPQTEIELTLVQCMIAAQWRLRRIWALEQAALLQQSSTTADPNPVTTPEGTWHIPAARTAAAFQSVHGRSGSGSVIHMAETRYQRQLSQALQQFRAIRKTVQAELEPEK